MSVVPKYAVGDTVYPLSKDQYGYWVCNCYHIISSISIWPKPYGWGREEILYGMKYTNEEWEEDDIFSTEEAMIAEAEQRNLDVEPNIPLWEGDD